jgi:reactive chlorine resistance protein C
MFVEAPHRFETKTILEKVGIHVSRYGLVVTLLLIGVLKFTAREAQGIQPLVASSPLMFWLYSFFSLQFVSNLIGAIEIAVAALIALRPFSAKLSFIGSIGAVITFVLTVSFLLVGRCRSIPHQGSGSPWRIDLDCRRSTERKLAVQNLGY